MIEHTEFVKIIGCKNCDQSTCRTLLRDSLENVPQPGYVGSDYKNKRVLLVGQNPGVPDRRIEEDKPYTAALRALRDEPMPQNYAKLQTMLERVIPSWPVTERYFPLQECGLRLPDIAYCNFVRCRTIENATPNPKLVAACRVHFVRWLDLLKPRVVVFIGKWAHDNGKAACERRLPNGLQRPSLSGHRRPDAVVGSHPERLRRADLDDLQAGA